ncbi:MAG: hypothetical protein ACP5I4_14270 [Oceanipulchritudo sp.]
MPFLETTLCGLLAGVVGALIMNLILRWISATFAEPVNMIEVLGSFFTGSRENAIWLGTLIHITAGAAFGTLYAWILNLIGATTVLTAFFAGIGLGFFHGLVAAYTLMVFVSERHPVQAFRQATLPVGLFHLVAHTLYGGFVGAAAGLLTVLVSGLV